MSELGERAIECCIEYDQAKKKIDKLTSKIHNRFTACEERQRKQMTQKDHEDKYEFMQRQGSVEPCLNMGYHGQEWNCEDCQKAYQLIQQRKEARQEFGIAKRRVRAVARAKYKKDD